MFILQCLVGLATITWGILIVLVLSIPFIELYQNIMKSYYIKDIYLKINNFQYTIKKCLIVGMLTTIIYFGVLSIMWIVGGFVLKYA